MKKLLLNFFFASTLFVALMAMSAEAWAQGAKKLSLEQLKAKYEQLAPGSPEYKEAKIQYKKALMEQQNALSQGSTRNQQGDVERSAGASVKTKGTAVRKTTESVVKLTEQKEVGNYNVVIAQPNGKVAAKSFNPNLKTKTAKNVKEYQQLLPEKK